uniref:FBA_2 domain-containing protein n=2 Tax=Caenorhabditis tropicalis TaxID=1561998 RepID=A0A1I7V4F9_9PELO
MIKTPMSRELVDMMIKKWKVKSVKINAHFSIKRDCHYRLNNREFITPFRLSDPFANTEKSKNNFKFDHVELNLTESSECARGITTDKMNEYKNIIANIRRIFPTDYIKITGAKVLSSNFSELYSEFYFLYNTIYIENQSNLRVDVELLTGFRKSEFHDFPAYFFNDPFDWEGRVHTCTVEDSPISRVLQLFDGKCFQQRNYTGKRVTYKGKTNNCVINFDVLSFLK